MIYGGKGSSLGLLLASLIRYVERQCLSGSDGWGRRLSAYVILSSFYAIYEVKIIIMVVV